MKKYIPAIATLFCVLILLQSCKKEQGPKYISLDETVQSGSTYSLDMSAYAAKDAEATISTQANHFTVSNIVKDAGTSCNVYHFSSDNKLQEKEKVVINLSGKNKGRCSHDENKTVVTINFTVL